MNLSRTLPHAHFVLRLLIVRTRGRGFHVQRMCDLILEELGETEKHQDPVSSRHWVSSLRKNKKHIYAFIKSFSLHSQNWMHIFI